MLIGKFLLFLGNWGSGAKETEPTGGDQSFAAGQGRVGVCAGDASNGLSIALDVAAGRQAGDQESTTTTTTTVTTTTTAAGGGALCRAAKERSSEFRGDEGKSSEFPGRWLRQQQQAEQRRNANVHGAGEGPATGLAAIQDSGDPVVHENRHGSGWCAGENVSLTYIIIFFRWNFERRLIFLLLLLQITTPSSGIPFNFDSLMEGGTGLTPVSTPLIPSCSTQQRNNHLSAVDLSSPDANPPKLVSLWRQGSYEETTRQEDEQEWTTFLPFNYYYYYYYYESFF